MLEFVIPCLLGLESLVGDEIRKLGLSDVRVENGRVLCRGEARDIARLNINLRCGARVILVLHKFRATDFESLFQGVRAVHWEDWIPREGEFPVVGYSINSTLHSVPACQSIVKRRSSTAWSAAYGIAQFPETGRRYQVRFSIMKDEVTVGLDTSGEGLYKRGYRAHGVARPAQGNARRRDGQALALQWPRPVLRPVLRQRHHRPSKPRHRAQPCAGPQPQLCRPALGHAR